MDKTNEKKESPRVKKEKEGSSPRSEKEVEKKAKSPRKKDKEGSEGSKDHSGDDKKKEKEKESKIKEKDDVMDEKETKGKSDVAASLTANFLNDEDEYSLKLTNDSLEYTLHKKAETFGNFLLKAFGSEPKKETKKIPLVRVLGTEFTGGKDPSGLRIYVFGPKDSKSGKRSLAPIHFQVVPGTKDGPTLIQTWHKEIQTRVLALRSWSKETRKLLVVVNPVSGKGEARKMYAKANRLFGIAGVPVEGIETIDAGHARRLGQGLDPKKYFAIATVSGDGLLNELLNGICERADALSILTSIPIGIIPGGTGNGLAASLNHNDVYTAAYGIIAGTTHPLDLFSANYSDKAGNAKRWFGFLSVNWAMLSVIDLESENLRFLGALRYDIKGILETLSADSYKGRVEYLLADDPKPAIVTATNKAANALDTPLLKGDRSKWKVIDDDKFFLFLATNLKYIQIADGPHSPGAELSDGCMDLVLLRDVDRVDLIKAMGAFEDGSFTKCAGVTVQKVKAFSISTDQTYKNKAPMDIDGERVESTKLDVEVHPAVASVFYDFGE